ncbi:helix-turn-helix domain-containing protein, partial [Corynebacterium lehmanniae]
MRGLLVNQTPAHKESDTLVRAVRDQGGTPTSVAKRFGISRQRVHQILNAYDAGGAEAIAPKSRAPHTHPHAIP